LYKPQLTCKELRLFQNFEAVALNKEKRAFGRFFQEPVLKPG
jgi:hypothetical protein